MDLEQFRKTVQWLDDERRKDKQEMAAQQERLLALGAENAGLARKLQQLETDFAAISAHFQRAAKMDELLDGYRKEMTRQLEDLEQRRLEADRENERLRKLEREGLNKSLTALNKAAEALPRVDRELQTRKEEEARISRAVSELQLRANEFNKLVDERNRAVAVLEEGRRQDTKRIAELQAETSELRRRADDARGKLEVLEDLARRSELRLTELAMADNERRMAQTQWIDAQSILQAERDRAWAEMKAKMEAALETAQDHARRVDQYAETFRDIRRTAEEYKQNIELIERRVAESAEIHRLAEERFRQEWAAFLADDQKRWSTHLLLRDEQWREHDRLNNKEVERADTMEEQITELQDIVRHLQTVDASRLQMILNLVREMAAEHEQQFAKVR
jgi:hypothetical protein